MAPRFVVASQDFERDLSILKDIMSQFERNTNYKDGYKLSEKGQKAAGWWFYEIYFNSEFMEKIIQSESTADKKIKNERDVLELIKNNLKERGSNARIRLYKDKPFLASWWKWLMK